MIHLATATMRVQAQIKCSSCAGTFDMNFSTQYVAYSLLIDGFSCPLCGASLVVSLAGATPPGHNCPCVGVMITPHEARVLRDMCADNRHAANIHTALSEAVDMLDATERAWASSAQEISEK